MFSSIRLKLSVAFAAVIILSLLLASAAFVFLVRSYHSRLAIERLADLAVPVSLQVNVLERAGASTPIISAFLQDQADEMGVRILLVDRNGQVVEDTQQALKGQMVDLQSPTAAIPSWDRVAYSGSLLTPDNTELYYVSARSPSPRPQAELFFSRSPSYNVVLAVPQQSIGSAWLSVAPNLSLAAILSLVLSVGVAIVIARSIARPVVDITRASEEMSRGRFDHNIVVSGRDEVARLAESFNDMARQVGRTNRTLRDFLANASHELKTPLTSIQGFSQAMIDGAITTPEDYARAAGIINAEAERMRHLVDDLLLLSRMEAGEVAMDVDAVDVADLLTTCVERFRWQAEREGKGLVLNLAPDLGRVLGDGRRLEQVLGNIIDNALRYTPQDGTVTITGALVNTESASTLADGQASGLARIPGLPTVRVIVHNTGSWIAADDLSRIFERFYRSHSCPERRGEGSGLGLAIVREIVLAHGGEVVARSDPEHGTEFEVELPAMVSGQGNKPRHRGRNGVLGALVRKTTWHGGSGSGS